MRTETPQTIQLKDYQPSAFLIDHVSLDFRLDPEKTRVFTRLDMRHNPKVANHGGQLVLDGENITLVSVSITGETLNEDQYRATDQKLIIFKTPDEPFTLELETTCAPQSNTALSGLYRSGGNFCTQCEAEGFRRITYYLDRPDILAKYRVRIEADKKQNPVLLANGNKVLEGDIEGSDRHFAIWEDPFPKPSYLFALVAGDLACYSDSFTTASGRNVALEIYVEHGKQDRCEWAMQSLKRSMKWDEDVFGREYDLDIFMIVAVSDFNMGAMENKGLNIFNDKYILALPETASDADYEHIESIIAHEYFHNWSGNRVTCRDWFQLCLKEGLTVFRDQEFSSDARSRPVKRIGDVKLLRAHQFPEDAGPLAHPVRPDSYIEINNFYTATIYEKGAEIVRMIHTLIGAKDFRKAMDLYFARHDGEAATVEDFVACMADVSGRDFDQFFRWYTQAGTPDVVAQGNYDAASKSFTLKLVQSTKPTPGQPEKQPLVMPLRLGLVGPDGTDYALQARQGSVVHQDVLEFTEREQTFVFDNIPARPVMSLNRNFSAPVNLTSNVSVEEKLFLMAKDPDNFNRFEACQELGEKLIIDIMRDERSANSQSESFIDALSQILDDTSLEAAFVAQMLTLPGNLAIAGKIARDVDPDAIHAAGGKLAAKIGNALREKLLQVFNAPTAGSYSADADAMGRRAARLAALRLIAAGDPQTGAELAFAQFENAAHMSDEYDALAALTRIDEPQRLAALDAFYKRHSDDHLLVDKWFALHAQAPFPETLGQVRELMDHEKFSLKKPNTARALMGTFAMANPVVFHAIDGSGYELFGDTVIELDKINPQVAARLAGAFRNWRMLEERRAGLARASLEKINQTPHISKDCFEITQKSLA